MSQVQSGNFVGIDTCKKELEVAIYNTSFHITVRNNSKGIQNLVDQLKSLSPDLIVIEATGGLELDAAKELYMAGFPIAIVNPRRTHAFSRAMGYVAKTDKIDAEILAHYAKAVKPDVSRFRTKEEEKLVALVRRRNSLVKMRAKEKTRLKSANKGLDDNIRQHIAWLNQAICDLEKEIRNHISLTPIFRRKDKIIQSFSGVGSLTSQVLLAEVPELGFLSRKEIAALVGVAPMNKDSGKSQGKRRIQGGRAAPRACLYMAAVTAIRYNSVIRSFYQRLRDKGKPFKVAITACMRKIIVILNAMIRDMNHWDPHYAKNH